MNIPQNFLSAIPLVNQWIDSYIRERGKSRIRISDAGFQRLPGYYSEQTLRSAFYAVVPIIETPPLKEFGLGELSFFEEGGYGGITFKDTYFVTESEKEIESLHFHELIHTIQWRTLGAEKFILIYGIGLLQCGYRNSPLEEIAYRFQRIFDSGRPIPNLEDLVRDHSLSLLRNIG